jgi:hypothetical protein
LYPSYCRLFFLSEWAFLLIVLRGCLVKMLERCMSLYRNPHSGVSTEYVGGNHSSLGRFGTIDQTGRLDASDVLRRVQTIAFHYM